MMDKKSQNNGVAPWHTGVMEAVMTGAGVGLIGAIPSLIEQSQKPSPYVHYYQYDSAPSFFDNAFAKGFQLCYTGAVLATTVGKLLEERGKYEQSHSSVNAASAQHQGVVSPTQQIATAR